MEITVLIVLGFAVRSIVSAVCERRAQVYAIVPKRESICLTCVHAKVARGYMPGEQLMHCTYGVSREMKFAVSDCTMFCHRDAKPELVRVVGFAEVHVDRSDSPSIAAQFE